jgi:hypothetical protein
VIEIGKPEILGKSFIKNVFHCWPSFSFNLNFLIKQQQQHFYFKLPNMFSFILFASLVILVFLTESSSRSSQQIQELAEPMCIILIYVYMFLFPEIHMLSLSPNNISI